MAAFPKGWFCYRRKHSDHTSQHSLGSQKRASVNRSHARCDKERNEARKTVDIRKQTVTNKHPGIGCHHPRGRRAFQPCVRRVLVKWTKDEKDAAETSLEWMRVIPPSCPDGLSLVLSMCTNPIHESGRQWTKGNTCGVNYTHIFFSWVQSIV